MEERLPTSKSPTKKDELWITKSRKDDFMSIFQTTEVCNKNTRLVETEKLRMRRNSEETEEKVLTDLIVLYTNYSRNP